MRVAVPPIPGSNAPTAMKQFPMKRCLAAGSLRNRQAETTAPPIRKIAA